MHSNRYPNKYINSSAHIQPIPIQQPPNLIPTSYQYQYQSPINPAISHTHISHPGSSLPTTSKQFLHYNNLINQNHQLFNDNQILLIKLQKYQKLQPYINSLISKNNQLQQQIQSLKTQNTYLTKNIKQLHVQSRNIQHTHNNKLKQLQNTIQIGKDNGIKIRLQNQNLNNKIKIYINQIQEYKKKMQQILTQKILHQQTIKQISSQRDKLLGQIKQLQIYNKQLVRNNNIKQQQYLQKIQNKQQTVKILQININQLHIQINKIKQELCIKNQQIKQMEYDFGILSKNHDSVLKDFRSVSLKKVQVQELLEQSLRKIGVRQNQLRQLQMFRQQQRLSFNNQLNKLQHAYNQQKYQYEQAIQHKSLKNQKLTHNYNQLLQKHEHLQTDLWELQHSLQQQVKQRQQKMYQIQLRQQHIQKLILQLQSYKQKQHTILQRLDCVQEQKQSLYNGLDLIQKKYTERQKQFDQFVQNMRVKFQDEKNKWYKLYQQQKMKLKMTHEYEKKQIQTSLNKKILILQGDIESYRCRLSRAEQDTIQKTHKQINQTRNIIQLNSKLSHLNLDKTFQRRSVEKKDRNRFSQQFQINSGSKTARPTLK